jgi:O-acetyl-ADP-ribose deacetylase (regulator of RNase III)
MKLYNKQGDILQFARENNIDIICHQVNCLGIMGGGLALQIKKEVLACFMLYESICREEKKERLLGDVLVWQGLSEPFAIANLFGQLELASPSNPQATNYDALRSSLNKLKAYCKKQTLIDYPSLKIAFPKNMGCGLGGGDWEIVEKMIKEIFGDERWSIYFVEKI